jgi:hypothetical protein
VVNDTGEERARHLPDEDADAENERRDVLVVIGALNKLH